MCTRIINVALFTDISSSNKSTKDTLLFVIPRVSLFWPEKPMYELAIMLSFISTHKLAFEVSGSGILLLQAFVRRTGEVAFQLLSTICCFNTANFLGNFKVMEIISRFEGESIDWLFSCFSEEGDAY